MFFNLLVPAENLWKGVTSVSNAGRKRGRGKGVGRKIAKNLNKGQLIGVGKLLRFLFNKKNIKVTVLLR